MGNNYSEVTENKPVVKQASNNSNEDERKKSEIIKILYSPYTSNYTKYS